LLGDGSNTLFWTDRWLDGACVKDFAPVVVASVGERASSSRTVGHALENWQWVSYIDPPFLDWVALVPAVMGCLKRRGAYTRG
jgi:hypothetical protein